MRTEDGCIIQDCLDGKSEAFGMLVDKYKEGIYAFVYTQIRDFQDAQDVTQEAFLQAYRDLHSLRRWESFSFWVYRIANRCCAQYFRTRSKRVDREFINDQASMLIDAPSLESYRIDRLNESVRESLDSLPKIYREVLLLHYFGGMTSRDIAKAIGISPVAVLKRLSRARAQLKEEIIPMMDTAFEGQSLPAGFTFHIVELVKPMKIRPIPRIAGLSWGLSLAVGLVITVLSLNSHMSWLVPEFAPADTLISSDTAALKTGEIYVDILKASQISMIARKGAKDSNKALRLLAPQNEPNLVLESGRWEEKGDMPNARYGMAGSAVNGKIYTIGGTLGDAAVSTVTEYNPATDKWTERADMPTSRFFLSTCVVNNKIYAIGGKNGGSLPTVEEYDPETDSWTKKSDMLTRRHALSTSVVNGKIYAIGGTTSTAPFSNVEEYDPATDTWTKKADMPTGRYGPNSGIVDGIIYVIGGSRGINSPVHSVEAYDPATDTWVKKTDMPTARLAMGANVLDGKIYVFGGGREINKILSTVEIYDPETDVWTTEGNMPTMRITPVTTTVNGKVYVLGGTAAYPVPVSTIEEYVPAGWESAVSPNGKQPTTWGEEKLGL